MKEPHIRFIYLLKILNTNQLKFSKTVGLSQGFINRVALGKTKISGELVKRIGKFYPKINLNWLLTGDGEVFVPEDNTWQVQDPGHEYGGAFPMSGIAKDDAPLALNLAKNIRVICSRWDLFQQELFDLLESDVSRPAIGKYMAGGTLPKVATLLRLEDLTGIPLYLLLTREIQADDLPPKPIAYGDAISALRAQARRLRDALDHYLTV